MKRVIHGEPVAIAPTGQRPGRNQIEGNLVVLEPIDLDRHTEALYDVSHESAEARQLWKFLPDGPFEDSADLRALLKTILDAPDRVPYAIRDKAGGRAAGFATYLDIRPAHGAIEIGYIWFAPFLQRTPQSTEALYLMLAYAFDELGYRRMQWRCNALNERSKAAALRLGFIFEGVFHQHMVVKGHNRDTAWYSILDADWPRLRDGFEQWLSPQNFDERGRQRKPLRDLRRQ